MEKFHVTREMVDTVLAHQYTQDDYSRDIGPHKTTYSVINNHPEYDEAFWQTALVMEAAARQAKGDFTAIHLPDLLTHLKGKDKNG